jgi:hypothetical protein
MSQMSTSGFAEEITLSASRVEAAVLTAAPLRRQ